MARFQYAEFAVSMTAGETQREVLDRLETLAGQLSAEVPELATDLEAKVNLARALADGQLTSEREQRAAQAQDRLTSWFTITCLSAGTTEGTSR
ncbi:MAG: hypothetical protein N2037_02545 [Acidimicrobiales bacterium]|nr:hypothetical protein [Acidimicrobiales bacterium]